MKTLTFADRNFILQDAVRKLQRQNPQMGYDAAFDEIWRTQNGSLEESNPKLAMMRTVQAQAANDTAAADSLAKKTASARFSGLVKAAMHTRQIGYDEAWDAMKDEQPELLAEMNGKAAGAR